MDARNFQSPGGGSCVEASFAEALEDATEIGAGDADGQQVRRACQGTTQQSGEVGCLAAAAVGEWSGKQPSE